MRITVRVGAAGFVLEDVPESEDREAIAASACSRVLGCYAEAHTYHQREFEVTFPDAEKMIFMEVPFGGWQRLAEQTQAPRISYLLDTDD